MSSNKKLKLLELGRISEAEFKTSRKIPVTLVLDNIRSMHNVGSFFRTADAFRLEKIMLCGVTAQPPHRDIEKTALGATNTVSWEYYNSTADACDALKKGGYLLCAIEQTEKSVELNSFTVSEKNKYALILGNEVKGVNQQVINDSDHSLEIPQFGTKHSLNVSVCGGVVIWHFFSALQCLLEPMK